MNAYSHYKNKTILAKLIGNSKSTMYDPILDQYVPFNGTLHHIATLSPELTLLFSPIHEAIYQRAVIRSDQFDLHQVDLSLIQSKHINKAYSETTTSLHNAFISAHSILPVFQNQFSITTLDKNKLPEQAYTSLFIGLGYMNYLKDRYPETQNTYLELAHHLAVDLRDGYFDGRTLKGDNTVFKSLVQAPINADVQKNTYIQIGETQKSTRENFGKALKQTTLDYAINDAFQSSIYPQGIDFIERFAYYNVNPIVDNYNYFRQIGAGDYRPAFGLMSTESCNTSTNACRQGLNVDDIDSYVNDVSYLIGRHQLRQCSIHFYPSGHVSITKGDQVYRGSINRDLSDNLQQLNKDPTHYLLNVGASENKPAYVLQFEIKDMNIIKARTGHNYDIYATSIETPEMDCGS